MAVARALAALRCACGSAAVMAIRPGLDPVRRGAVDLFTRVDPLTHTGAPDAAWCLVCWRAAFRARGDSASGNSGKARPGSSERVQARINGRPKRRPAPDGENPTY